MATFIEREFAGEVRRFQIPLANPQRLYRGLENESLGTIADLARMAAGSSLGRHRVERVLVHALSRGHPLTLMRMEWLVRSEMQDKPLTEFLELAVEIIAATYAGSEGSE